MANRYGENINSDLGLGSRVAQQSRLRFLNKDGGFNVFRGGLPFFQRLNFYSAVLNISWFRFYLFLAGGYFTANVFFALLYVACGPDAFIGTVGMTFSDRFFEAFFFSVQTISTIGYGRISPQSMGANAIVSVEALTGLLGFAMATGLLFARFSRPRARIVFSHHALIAPYHDGRAFEFRVANQVNSELIDVHATVVFTQIESVEGEHVRKFYTLALERPSVMFFPLHWVVVHPITEDSPLYAVDADALRGSDAEFLVLITALDETSSQTVHTRSSYKHDEVIWEAKFTDIFAPSSDGKMRIDVRKINDYEKTG